MFDISFGELMIIGVVALIVIGPQRLPGVARTLGHLVGRAQRYVNDVKRDIQKEIDLDELNKVKTQMETAARSVQSSVQNAATSLAKPLEETQAALHEASQSIQDSVKLDPPPASAAPPQVAPVQAVQPEANQAATAAPAPEPAQAPLKAESST